MRFKPKKADFVFIGLVTAVIVFVTLLPGPRDNNPPVPRDFAHRQVTSEKACMACHIPRGARPLSSRHPKRSDCLRCHRQPTV